MSGWDRYAHAEAPPEPFARCPKCRRLTVEYDRRIQSWACWACGWRDR